MKINEWKKSWKGKEMDQVAREEKRHIKKKKVRENQSPKLMTGVRFVAPLLGERK